MKHSESLENIATALAVAQGKMKPAHMDSVNPFLKNKYASLNSIMDACRDVLAESGLAVLQMPTTPDGHPGTVGLTTRLIHISGEYVEDTFYLPMNDEKGKSTAQVAGSIITYLRRYALAAMLGIVADEDTDGNSPPDGAQNGRQPTAKVEPMASKAQLKRLHQLGVQCYGDEWDDKRPGLVMAVTKDRAPGTKSANDLSSAECARLIGGIEKKLEEKDEKIDF